MKTSFKVLLVMLLALPAVAHAQFTFTTNNGTITITKYTGPGGAVAIPNATNGLPITGIGSGAFQASRLTSVTIGTNIASIGTSAFSTCSSLTAIIVDTNNPAYSSTNGVLFDKSQKSLLQYPGGVSGGYAIPGSVISIGDSAFAWCYTYLTGITIPPTVTSIGKKAFWNCNRLSGVTIPGSVTNIGDYAFSVCYGLSAITVDSQNPYYTSTNGVLFNKSQTTLIQYPTGGSDGSYTIPDSVNNIGGYAFDGCGLTNIAIPSTVTNIDRFAFSTCSKLTYVVIPNGVTSIGDSAFDNTKLTSLTIPNSVITFGSWVFDHCTSLTNVTLGIGLTNIGSYAFGSCTNLTGSYFQGNTPGANSTVFSGANNATVYYLPGTTGWGSTFGGRPTALWFLPNPLMLTSGSSFGVKTNRFGFTISWATNIPVVVEACTDLANHAWSPVSTNTLTSGSSYFSDPQWTNYPARLYRLRSP